jgi:hypothetical protein
VVESRDEMCFEEFQNTSEDGGDRTHDPLIKSELLYRLSYVLLSRSIIIGETSMLF